MKILLAAPHSALKNYCIHEWILNAKSFGCDIFIADNSPGNANYSLYKKYKIDYIWVDPAGRRSEDFITECQNRIRDYFLAGSYTHLFFLETDLFPPKTILPVLESLGVPMVSVPYFILKGKDTIQMNQEIKLVGKNAYTRNYSLFESFIYTDGQTRQCFAAGFGCTLFERWLIEKISFRWTGDNFVVNDDGSPSHSDSFFYADLQRYKIPAYLYSGVTVRHYNQDWFKTNEQLTVNN